MEALELGRRRPHPEPDPDARRGQPDWAPGKVGYAAASLEDIADRAGYSKGAVYSNFVDKPNLCREVLQALPMEFAMEAQSLVAISLEGSVG